MSFENKNTLTRILLNSMNIGIFRTHIDGQILNANLVLAKMYGFDSIDEFIQKPIMERYVDLNQRKELFAKLSEHGQVQNFEIQTRHKNGTIFNVSVSGTLKYDYKGNPLFMEGVIEMITQSKKEVLIKEEAFIAQRLEDCMIKLRQSKVDLNRANQVKDEFFSIMSHELRTPLSTVLTMSELLQDDTYGALNKEQSKAIKYIENSGNHLLSLITDILVLSQIEAGQIQLKIRYLQIETLCQDSLQFVRATAQKKQIKLLKTTDGNVTSLQADESGLTQILRHLLTNAVKFTPEGGQVRLEIIGDELDGVVQISVIDTGIGIAEDKMEYLFQPFVQLDARLARQYEGTGLGLSLIYQMVKLHGGSVKVESEIGKGSHFTILLPWQGNENLLLIPKKSEKHQMVKKQTLDSGSLLILLAEDYEKNIAELEKNLQAEGYQVIFFNFSEKVIELIKEKIPALILMDIPMHDDIKVIQHIRTFAAFANIPIIVLSALIIPGDRERYLQAGANDYLSKPVNIKKLVRMIET
jgi:PAS domain S-box-containing protein